MSNVKKPPTHFRVTTGKPEYVETMADRLAELAIVRVTELAALKPPRGSPELPFQMIAASATGVCFLVEVEAYSASHLKMGEPAAIPVLELRSSASRVRAASESSTPVVLFLFDADRGHGRYLRLDTLPKPADHEKTVVLSFPVESTITGDSIRALAEELGRERRATA